MDWWQRLQLSLEKLRQLVEAISRGEYCCLRHGLPYVWPGILVNQSYCEFKLDNDLKEGNIGEPLYRDVRLLVEAILDAKRRITSKPSSPIFAASIPIAAIVEKVPMIGRPDAIVFKDGMVAKIIYVKETKKPEKIFKTDKIRLYAYGLIADYSPLPTPSNFALVLVAGSTRESIVEALKLIRNMSSVKGAIGDAYIHTLIYDRDTAFTYIGPLLEYWMGLRDPIPSKSPGKCIRCKWQVFCQGEGVDWIIY